MGTEKRERQKANKAMRAEEEARAETRARTTRIGLIVVGAIAALVALVFVINALSDDGDSGEVTIDEGTTEQPAEEATNGDSADEDGGSDATADSETSGDTDEATDGDAASASGNEEIPEDCPPAEGTDEQTQSFDEAPPFCLDPNVSYVAQVTTNKGEFTIALDQERAPNTVNNFVYLARNRYFDETECHRIIPGFVVQCGDPTATGTGNPGYRFEDELPAAGEYEIGSIAMANSGPDTNGSQFFIITGEQGAALPPQYSLFGGVTDGFEETVVVMEASGTASGDPSEPIVIESVVITTV